MIIIQCCKDLLSGGSLLRRNLKHKLTLPPLFCRNAMLGVFILQSGQLSAQQAATTPTLALAPSSSGWFVLYISASSWCKADNGPCLVSEMRSQSSARHQLSCTGAVNMRTKRDICMTSNSVHSIEILAV